MNGITQNNRYLPHETTAKVQSVKLYRQTKDIGFVCRRYHISKASLMRWNKLYDGTKILWHRNHTGHIRSIPTLTRRMNWPRSETCIGVIPTLACVRCTGSCEKKSHTAGIPVHCIECLFASGSGPKWNPQRKSPDTTGTMTHQQSWGLNDRWM